MSTQEFASKVGTDADRYREIAGTLAGAAPSPSAVPQTDSLVPIALGDDRWGDGDGCYFNTPKTAPCIPAGVYKTMESSRYGPMLMRFALDTDKLIVMPDDASRDIVAEVETFWSSEAAFRRYGFLHKRGFLLWGPPGSGKTSLLTILMQKLVVADGVVVFVEEPRLGAECLKILRRIEPRRRAIAVYEDIDALIHRYGESGYLALLDGEHQIDSIVNIATTNYPERLDKRFADRPSRFDTVKKIDMPSAEARRAYFMHAAPDLDEAELRQLVGISKGFSIAHLKEILIATKVLGQHLSDVIERMEVMRDGGHDSTKEGRGKVGFAPYANGARA